MLQWSRFSSRQGTVGGTRELVAARLRGPARAYMDGSAELDVQATPAFAVLDELFKSGKIGTETK